MGKIWNIYTSDETTDLTVVGGEVIRKEVSNIGNDQLYREEKRLKYLNGRTAFRAAIEAVRTELTNWDAYNTADIKASLKNVIIPGLRDAMRGIVFVGDTVFDSHADSGTS